MKIAPRNGMIVIDPLTRMPLPDEGADIVIDSYWQRRLDDQDVAEVAAATESEPERAPSNRKQRNHREGE
jgi:hypothetical protein